MATVVITFFLLTLTRFCVYKMDAKFLDRRRSSEISRRERRWSMNSQRLEEIVAELMKPISDVRRSFDTDLSALLEEYLTEAGLHALEACEGEGEGGELAADGAPNFTELALLLQHSASVYGRKVDFLYQHVLAVSDSLQNSAQELEQSGEAEEAGGEGAAGGRRRPRSACAGFAPIELTPSNGASKEAGVARPPPTLPRVYVELEPRCLSHHHRPLTDYQAEPAGLLRDYHAARRLQDGTLVDELEGWGGGGARSLRPIPLMELQAAIAAAAPPSLPPLALPPTPPHSPHPLCASTPLDPALLPVAVKKERKRRSDVSVDCLAGGTFKIRLNKKVRRRLQKLQEFSVDSTWVAGVVRRRAANVLAHRANCTDPCEDFRGFENSQIDIGGFLGWSSSEAGAAAALARSRLEAVTATTTATDTTTATAGAEDSDDDGFFEQSSNGDSDTSRADDHVPSNLSDAAMWAAWQAEVVSRAEAGAARPLDVREQAARVLAQLPRAPCPLPRAPCDLPRAPCDPPPAPAAALLAVAKDNHDVAGLFLATLFLANAGNVEIIQGAPLTLNSFSVRFVSADESRYCTAAAADAALIHPPPPPR